MSLSGPPSNGGGAYASQSNAMAFQGSGGMQQMQMGYGNGANGMNAQYANNPSMMQMTPYGLAQQPPQQQQQGYMGNSGYGGNTANNGMMMGGNGLAGPGGMLQIQAAGYDPYQQQQQQANASRDPFSAFDGL